MSPPRTYIAADAVSLPLAEVAAASDCFTTSDLPDQTIFTATLDLQPLITADSDFSLDDYPTVLLAPFRQGAELHGLPYEVYFRTLNYNVTAFDAAGIAHPSAAWTLDDLLNAAQQLTRGSGADKQYGFAATIAQTSDVLFFIDHLGAAMTTGSSDAPQPNFTDPKVVQALRTYLDLLRHASPHQRLQGYVQNDTTDVAYGMITTGQVGMWLDYGPTFIDPGAEPGLKRVNRAIAPPPLGGVVTPNDFRVRGLYISARTQQAQACWTWLKHLSHNLSGIGAGFPARTALAESDAFTSQAVPGAIEVYKAYQAAFARTSSADLASELFGRSQLDYFWFFRAIDQALRGVDLERELANAQSLTEQYLACVRAGAKDRDCARQVDSDYQGIQNTPL